MQFSSYFRQQRLTVIKVRYGRAASEREQGDRELGANPREVASPSFAIVHEYPRPAGPPVIHIDGYRLSESRREWLEIGIPELLAAPGVKLIEWPKREFEEFEDSHLEVSIRVLDDGAREISVDR